MCEDEAFDPESSNMVYGPINKPRWIYAAAKQLMDRVIHAYGMQEGLRLHAVPPLQLDRRRASTASHTPKEGSSCVITQFLGHIVRGEPIRLVDGGSQQRAFTYVDDGIAALVKIIANEGGVADQKIYNIGNPANNYSIRALAEMMLALARTLPEYAEAAAAVRLTDVSSAEYYGRGYQDVAHRVPDINATMKDLDWKPQVGMQEALASLFAYYRDEAEAAADLAL